MLFIELDHGVLANPTQVQTIEATSPKRPGGPQRSRVTFADGRTIVTDRRVRYFEKRSSVVLPAPPGYRQITHHGIVGNPVDPLWFEELPVLAFQYDGQNGGPMLPITDEGPTEDVDNWALIRPDGTVTDWSRSYDTVEAYKVEVEKRLTSDAQPEAA